MTDAELSEFVLGLAAVVIARTYEAVPDEEATATVMTVIDLLVRWAVSRSAATNEQVCADLLYSLREF